LDSFALEKNNILMVRIQADKISIPRIGVEGWAL
jgi:hypothetical protein